MNQGDIYLVSLDPTAGHEQRGRRPVLIISPNKFNALTQTPITLPITTKSHFARVAGFAVSLETCGTKTIGIIRCDQPRVLDIIARGGKYIERVPCFILDEVLAKLATLIS